MAVSAPETQASTSQTAFCSVLFLHPEDRAESETREAPACFGDLNLDQVVEAVTVAKQAYDLKRFYYSPLHDVDAIQYRHEVMQDLERRPLFEKIEEFARRMRTMREHLKQAEKLYYKLQKQRWFLDAVTVYCSAVRRLAEDLAAENPQSRGFGALRAYLDGYVAGEAFQALAGELQELSAWPTCVMRSCSRARR